MSWFWTITTLWVPWSLVCLHVLECFCSVTVLSCCGEIGGKDLMRILPMRKTYFSLKLKLPSCWCILCESASSSNFFCRVRSFKPGEHARVQFSFSSLGISNSNSYQVISNPPPPQRVWRACIQKSSHPHIKEQPPTATEHFSFPLKEMRKKGNILGGGNAGKRSVAIENR